MLSSQDFDDMKSNIKAFIELLPDGASLTDEQRMSYSAINVANKVFVENVLSESGTLGPDILPAFIKLSNLDLDLSLFRQLDDLESHLNNALQRTLDAKRIAGHEAYSQALAIYNAVKMASDAGIPNAKSAYAKLKVRFEAQGNSGGRTPAEIPTE